MHDEDDAVIAGDVDGALECRLRPGRAVIADDDAQGRGGGDF